MLIPKVIPKKRYFHKIDYRWAAKGNTRLNRGSFGLLALEGAWITNKQIEAARKVLTKDINSFGKIDIRIFPHLPKTKKPLEVRMGSGKGSVEVWVAVVKANTIMFELVLDAIKYRTVAINSLKKASSKLPIKLL